MFGKNKQQSPCESDFHESHLCYLVSQGFHMDSTEKYESMVNDAKFMCGHCGRIANYEKNLCKPVPMQPGE